MDGSDQLFGTKVHRFGFFFPISYELDYNNFISVFYRFYSPLSSGIHDSKGKDKPV